MTGEMVETVRRGASESHSTTHQPTISPLTKSLLFSLGLDLFLDIGVDVFHLGLAAQCDHDLLRLALDHAAQQAVSDGFKRWHLALAFVLDLDEMPAELRLYWLGNVALIELEGGLFELRHHLAAAEISERSALVFRAR